MCCNILPFRFRSSAGAAHLRKRMPCGTDGTLGPGRMVAACTSDILSDHVRMLRRSTCFEPSFARRMLASN